MFGDSFFTARFLKGCTLNSPSFRPHVWGFFFHNRSSLDIDSFFRKLFSSPCLGILFSQHRQVRRYPTVHCFRPHVWGFFFHRDLPVHLSGQRCRFRPHVWGFFFHIQSWMQKQKEKHRVFVPMFGDSFFTVFTVVDSTGDVVKFSSPCLGILFSRDVVKRHASRKSASFSSPCLGILFSQFETASGNTVKFDVFVPMFGDSFFTLYGVHVG